MTLAFKEGFDVSGEVVELAFLAGFFDLAMSPLFELIQFPVRRTVFTSGVVHGLHRDGPQRDNLAIHDDPDVVPLERPAQELREVAAGGGRREGQHAHAGKMTHFRRKSEREFQ